MAADLNGTWSAKQPAVLGPCAELSHPPLGLAPGPLKPQDRLPHAIAPSEEWQRRWATHDLDVGRRIQQSLLPKTLPVLPGFALAGFCQNAPHVGGDLYDVIIRPDDSLLLVMADVMGKGVSATLFAATLRALLRTLSEWTRAPAELLARINRHMFEELSSVDMFITVQIAAADLAQRRLRLANAGHCPLLLRDRQGQTRAFAPEGLPVGILAEAGYAETLIELEPGSCVVLYTDGLTETRNEEGEFFGQARLEDWLHHTANGRQTAVQLRESFVAELRRFRGRAEPADDQSLLILADEAPADSSNPPIALQPASSQTGASASPSAAC